MTTGFKLHEFLKNEGVPFEVIGHPRRWTALDTAVSEHVLPQTFAKVVMVKIKGKDAMFVIPADRQIDLFKLRYAFDTEDLHMEEESEFQDIFTDSEKGAMPPFGFLYGIAVYGDAALEEQDAIVFNAGSHTESIKMALKDYLVLAEAELGDYSVPKHLSGRKKGGGTDEIQCG